DADGAEADKAVMRKLFSVALLLVAVVAFVAGVMIMKPGLRTKWYFAADRTWTSHWPLPRGNGIIRDLKPLIRPTAPAWVTIEPSVTMLLDPEDYVSNEILRTGRWEHESWEAIRPYLPQDAVFVDVGAHIGYYSLKAAAVLGPRGRVIAVEPNPPTVRELRDNIAASNAAHVHVYPVACSDKESTLVLYAAPRANTGQSSLSRANAGQEGAVAAEYKVPARPLDAIVLEDGVRRVDVIKVDVEGAEMLVMRGAGWTLDRFHPVVMVELIEKQLQAMGTSTAEVRAFFAAHGYVERVAITDNVVFGWKDSGTGDARPAGTD
ncbi:MAG TPA: FkbM family methyltransferase, partial [Vicinamibacterales bacterium]|nr:FkbM family methyltransferase [Vicinamibacterales bacterium]